MNSLYRGDCLEIMPTLPAQSVDMILCDLPYGTTAIEWDKPIPFDPLWAEYERIIKPNGAIVLFSGQPFTTDLIQSKRKLYRYEIIWKKTRAQGYLNANKSPLRAHENIIVFYKNQPTYNVIKQDANLEKLGSYVGRVKNACPMRSKQYREMDRTTWIDDGKRYPTDVIEFPNPNNRSQHPTQKPVDMLKFLVMTYTNPGEKVLDNCMGAGSTGVACVETGRNFIGIEINQKYFDIASKRISQAPPPLFTEEQPRHLTPLALDNGDSPVLPGFD